MADYEPYIRKVQYYETDRMGIVHHSNYIRWFEEARNHFLGQRGIRYEEWEASGIIIPVIEASAKYRKHMTFGDTFRIEVMPASFKYVKFTCDYKVYNEDTGDLCATGSTSHCFLNKELKLFRIQSEFPELYESFRKAMES